MLVSSLNLTEIFISHDIYAGEVGDTVVGASILSQTTAPAATGQVPAVQKALSKYISREGTKHCTFPNLCIQEY